MSYLLDTNVVSELVRPKSDPGVLDWFDRTPDDALHLSVLSLGEIRKGVENLGSSPRREALRVWLEQELTDWFGDRILPVDRGVADEWGILLAHAGRPVPTVDSLLAATALYHDLRLATRNVTDFRFTGLEVINPWDSANHP